eukprot:Rhum_TRINITY_DN15598_c0_g1::Rhum_TRINITY_DN15598_c0_g1_i1::g.161416::m.161416
MALRENLIAEWKDNVVFYCSPGGKDAAGMAKRESIWAVVDGDLEGQFEVKTEEQGWLDDAVVELSTNADATCLLIRGVETCYAAALPRTVAELRLSPHLQTQFIYSDLGVTACRFHPAFPSILLALTDSSVLSTYCVATGALLCYTPLRPPLVGDADSNDDDTPADATLPVVAFTPVYTSATVGVASLLIFTAIADGSIEVLGPFAPPNTLLSAAVVDSSLDCGERFESAVRERVCPAAEGADDAPSMYATVAPEELEDGGSLPLPFQQVVESACTADEGAAGTPLALFATEAAGEVALHVLRPERLDTYTFGAAALCRRLANTTAQVSHKPVSTASLSLCPSPASTLFQPSPPVAFKTTLHQYRYGFAARPHACVAAATAAATEAGGSPAIGALYRHAWGVGVLRVSAGGWQTPVDEGSLVSGPPLLFPAVHAPGDKGASYVVSGAACYADLHVEEQVAMVVDYKDDTSEVVLDFVEARGDAAAAAAPAAASPLAECSLTQQTRTWAESEDAAKRRLHEAMCGVAAAHRLRESTGVEASSSRVLDVVRPVVESHAEAAAALEAVRAQLQARADAHRAGLEALQAEVRASEDAVVQATREKAQELRARIAALRAGSAGGKHVEAVREAKAVLTVSAALTDQLQVADVVASAGEMRALMAACVPPVVATPRHEAQAGAAARILKAGEQTSTLLFPPSTTLEFPNTAFTARLSCPYERALQVADEKVAGTDRATERIVRQTTSVLKSIHSDITAALQ